MGAKDSKTSSQYSEKKFTQDDFVKANEMPKTRRQQHLRQSFESKLSANAEEFSPSKVRAEAAKDGKYANQKNEPWVQFLLQKERDRRGRAPGQNPSATKQPIVLQTGEYLKLLEY
jgi:hypothetical protein